MRSGPRHAVAMVLLVVAGWTVRPVQAIEESEFDGQNFAFAAVLGSGFYDINGRRALIARLPLRYVVRREEKGRWGLRVLFPATFGWFNLEEKDLILPDDPTNIGTFSIATGVEFRFRVTRKWLLKPFVVAGPAKDFEGGELVWLAAAGVGSRVDVPWERRKIIILNRLLYAVNFSHSVLPDDDLALFDTRVEYLEKITGRTAIGVVAANELYFDEVGVLTPDQVFAVRHRYEIGLSYGAYKKFKWKRMAVPRVSLSYRFGQGISGIKIGFNFDY